MSAGAVPQAVDGLKPTDPVEVLAAEIARWSADTLAVGHLPFVGRLASQVLVGDANSPRLAFAPGSLACPKRDTDVQWTLPWMLRPELLAEDSG